MLTSIAVKMLRQSCELNGQWLRIGRCFVIGCKPIRGPGVGLQPILLRRTFAAKICLLVFIHYMWLGDQLVCISAPPTSLYVASF